MSVRRFHRGKAAGFWPWLLSYVLLVQALVPIQAHTSWITGQDGQVVLVCSWQGERTVVLGGDHDSPVPSDEHRAPACVFSQLLGAAVAPAVPTPPQAVLQLASLHVEPASDLTDLRRPLRQAIRAPPLS